MTYFLPMKESVLAHVDVNLIHYGVISGKVCLCHGQQEEYGCGLLCVFTDAQSPRAWEEKYSRKSLFTIASKKAVRVWFSMYRSI